MPKKKTHPRFVGLPYSLLEHRAFIKLSPTAVRIYIELKKRFNGRNNGEISLSVREAANLCLCGKDKANKAISELHTHGFILYASKGMFTYRKASTFILTCEQYKGKPKTCDWNYWPDNDGNKRKEQYLMPDV